MDALRARRRIGHRANVVTATDQLLAELAATLDGSRSARQRLLDEIREDIHDSVQAERRRGLETAAAEDVVITRFGSPLALAASWNRDHAKRRRAIHRNVALVLVAAATAATLGITQHASGKSPPARTRCVDSKTEVPPVRRGAACRTAHLGPAEEAAPRPPTNR